MMKKSLVTGIAILALVSFGTVPSARAFVGTTALTVICGSIFVAVVAGTETVKHVQAENEKTPQKETIKIEQIQPGVEISPKL